MGLAKEKTEKRVTSQNVTVQPEFGFAMSDLERPEETGVLAEASPPCVALVPLVQSTQWSRAHILLPRPDPTFVAQLIATAEQMPQTRVTVHFVESGGATEVVLIHDHLPEIGICLRHRSGWLAAWERLERSLRALRPSLEVAAWRHPGRPP